MLTLVVYVLVALLAVALLFGVGVAVLPRGEQLSPPVRDQPSWALGSAAMSGEDVARTRLPVAWRGYRFEETDRLLDRLAEELRSPRRPHRRAGGPSAGTRRAADGGSRGGRAAGGQRGGHRVAGGRPGGPAPTRRAVTDPPRCGWASSAPEYVAYHDDEWGRPLHGDAALFERVSLEAFQSGLSWLVILRKRPAFRAAFAGFDPATVAAFGPADVARLLADAGIVRNRAKIEATIGNARRLLDAVPEGLDALLWSFAPAAHPRPATPAEVPASSPESVAMARELRRRGFRFVGPTTAYALMQATGMVDDHVVGCWRAR